MESLIKPFKDAVLLEMVRPLSKGEEVTEQTHDPKCGNNQNGYATRDGILKIFNEDLNGL